MTFSVVAAVAQARSSVTISLYPKPQNLLPSTTHSLQGSPQVTSDITLALRWGQWAASAVSRRSSDWLPSPLPSPLLQRGCAGDSVPALGSRRGQPDRGKDVATQGITEMEDSCKCHDTTGT